MLASETAFPGPSGAIPQPSSTTSVHAGTGSDVGPGGSDARSTAPVISGRRDDRRERLGVEAGAADERAVDVGQREQLGGVLRLDAAAVEDARQLRLLLGERPATSARTNATASCACSAVATRPVPIAQIGS